MTALHPTRSAKGWVRFVRFQEVGRAQRMTEKGAKPPILPPSEFWPICPRSRPSMVSGRQGAPERTALPSFNPEGHSGQITGFLIDAASGRGQPDSAHPFQDLVRTLALGPVPGWAVLLAVAVFYGWLVHATFSTNADAGELAHGEVHV